MNGSCLCGSVSFKLNTPVLNVVNCHCNFCRSHSGAAFSTYAIVKRSGLEIVKGEEKLKSFGKEAANKNFCGECGTPIFNVNGKYLGACMVYFGTLENRNALAPQINIWCESMVDWANSIQSISSLPQGVESRK